MEDQNTPSHAYDRSAPRATTDLSKTVPQLASAVATMLFPERLNLYSVSATENRYFLGVHRADPLYAIKTWFDGDRGDDPFVSIHDGPSQRDAILTSSTRIQWGNGKEIYTVRMPPTVGSNADSAQVTAENLTFRRITEGKGLRMKWHHEFEMHTDGSGTQPQKFEWRTTRVGPKAWTLTRVGEQQALARMQPHGGSLTKFLCFYFLPGAKSGNLGSRWEIMALITGFSIHHEACLITDRSTHHLPVPDE